MVHYLQWKKKGKTGWFTAKLKSAGKKRDQVWKVLRRKPVQKKRANTYLPGMNIGG